MARELQNPGITLDQKTGKTMNRSDFIRIFMLLAIAALHSPVIRAAQAATEWQDHAAIRTTAESYLQATVREQQHRRTEIRLGQLDPRLRLKACHSPLEAYMPAGSRSAGNTTVAVRCPDDGGWNIYVSARIDVFAPVLVSRQPLARGARLQTSDLELAERNLANLNYGYYTDTDAVAGMVVKRMISMADVITPQMVEAPRLVQRGEQVIVIAESGNLSIRSSGKALSDGKSGDVVRIEATGSRRIVDGIVVSQGVVKVTL
jgi:flagella basal body P-ring formation protein FlgA